MNDKTKRADFFTNLETFIWRTVSRVNLAARQKCCSTLIVTECRWCYDVKAWK
ncbi:MAG: hypothetical protein HOP33_06490 [Verrucomicrobia bacterium]|nr:hypothetical protein [Verrucomicrobiota bacterium]